MNDESDRPKVFAIVEGSVLESLIFAANHRDSLAPLPVIDEARASLTEAEEMDAAALVCGALRSSDVHNPREDNVGYHPFLGRPGTNVECSFDHPFTAAPPAPEGDVNPEPREEERACPDCGCSLFAEGPGGPYRHFGGRECKPPNPPMVGRPPTARPETEVERDE